MLHVTGTTQCEMFAQAPSRIRVSSSKFDSFIRFIRSSSEMYASDPNDPETRTKVHGVEDESPT